MPRRRARRRSVGVGGHFHGRVAIRCGRWPRLDLAEHGGLAVPFDIPRPELQEAVEHRLGVVDFDNHDPQGRHHWVNEKLAVEQLGVPAAERERIAGPKGRMKQFTRTHLKHRLIEVLYRKIAATLRVAGPAMRSIGDFAQLCATQFGAATILPKSAENAIVDGSEVGGLFPFRSAAIIGNICPPKVSS